MPRPDAGWEFEAIGTSWQIDADSVVSAASREAVGAVIADFDRTWSRFRDDSVVARIAREGGSWVLGPESRDLLDLYVELHTLTDGAVTPLVGGTLADLGYDASYSLVASETPRSVAPWSDVAWSYPDLTTSRPLLLDVGAAGKGALVDLVSGVLGAADVGGFTVDASGDIAHRGAGALRVALEHPRDPGVAVGVVELASGTALCASATNRRTWGDGLHHVLDGRTGLPTHDVSATWVVADTCLLADGLATALFFADPERVAARYAFSFVRMFTDGRVEWSTDLPGEVFV